VVNEKNVEEIFDIFQECAIFLYENLKMNYYDSVMLTAKNILDKDTIDMDKSLVLKYKRKINKFKDSYNVEELRKGLNYVFLNCFKEMRWNINITPDVIVYLINYLVDKLYPKKEISILDPCIGSGNLLFGVSNNRNVSALYGIDIDDVMINLASIMGDFIEPVNLFYQNNLTVELENIDLIVSDLDYSAKDTYDFIIHNIDSLKEERYMILLIDNDFFTEIDKEKKEIIDSKAVMQGIIELPDSFFKNKKKSVVIIKRSTDKVNNFLIAKMPDVNDTNAMSEFLNKIELYFLNGGN
jgi:site-specific DNA-methyltransferase (adenine-specific)